MAFQGRPSFVIARRVYGRPWKAVLPKPLDHNFLATTAAPASTTPASAATATAAATSAARRGGLHAHANGGGQAAVRGVGHGQHLVARGVQRDGDGRVA